MYYTSKEVYLPGNHYTSRQVYEYISRQTNDPIVEWKTCVVSGTQFPIYQSDLDFYAKISPTFAGERFQIPTPTLCPEERQRRRLSFRNERKLYKRNCDATGDQIISIYSPDKPYKVYDQKFRRSDQWDPMDYGRGFDFSKSFTENFRELMKEVPRITLHKDLGIQSKNSEYTNEAGGNKDCYMVFKTGYAQNCMLSNNVSNSIQCIDCLNVHNSNTCYNSTDCNNCFTCINCYQCNNCSFCYGSNNLENKSYVYCNVQLTKEEYVSKFNNATFQQCILSSSIFNNIYTKLSDNCIGNNIFQSKEAIFCFDVDNIENCKYCYDIIPKADLCYDVNIFGDNLSRSCEVEVAGTFSKELFSTIHINSSKKILYSQFITNSSHLFGCIGLRNKSYCIFNKQYTKEEYEIQVAKIIRHMMETGERGEFFRPSLSPFGYNETVAQEYYPVTPPSPSGDEVGVLRRGMSEGQGEVLGTLGYHRSTYSSDPKIPEGARVIDCRLPERGEDTQQRKNLNQTTIFDYYHTEGPVPPTYDICKQIILCELSGRPFMFQKAEIDFYRKHNLPLPRKHPDVRHEERMKLRPGRTLFLRTCDCCQKEMLSVYPASQSGGEETIQKVYCEECYQKEVYG